MASRAGKLIAAKQLAQREAMWPGAAPWLWDRNANKGFATIPKTMPLILSIMDDLSNGKPVSSTYLGLWCNTWDNSMVNLSRNQEMAHAAGFTGQRAAYTWRARMQLLQKLKFIDIKPGKLGDISHVLIWNPHRVIRYHRDQKTPGLIEANFNALLERALDIGANDMIDEVVIPVVAAPVPALPASVIAKAEPASEPAPSDALPASPPTVAGS
jgi:hypothetical protein